MEERQDQEDLRRFRTPPSNGYLLSNGVNRIGQQYGPGTTPVYPQRYYSDPNAPKLGLIRGYHRQMYKPEGGQLEEPCCNSLRTGSKRVHPLDGCNWGVACGCILLILGVLAILMGFMMPQKAYGKFSDLKPEERDEMQKVDLFIDVFVVAGLSVLSVGGLVISVALLFPLLRRKSRGWNNYHNEPINFFGDEVYIKAEETSKDLTKPESKQAVNLGFHKDFEPGDVSLRKVQPKGEKAEPIDLPTSKS